MVPRTIAENSGLNATDAVAALYQAHAAGQAGAGLDVETGGWPGPALFCCGVDAGVASAGVLHGMAMEGAWAGCAGRRPTLPPPPAAPPPPAPGAAKDLGAEGVYDLYSTKW